MKIKLNCKICKKQQEVGLDKKTEKAYCCVCKSLIPDAGHFQIQKLKLSKQFRSSETQVRGAFFVKCKECESMDKPNIKDDEGFCKVCNSNLNLSKFWINGYKEYMVDGKDS